MSLHCMLGCQTQSTPAQLAQHAKQVQYHKVSCAYGVTRRHRQFAAVHLRLSAVALRERPKSGGKSDRGPVLECKCNACNPRGRTDTHGQSLQTVYRLTTRARLSVVAQLKGQVGGSVETFGCRRVASSSGSRTVTPTVFITCRPGWSVGEVVAGNISPPRWSAGCHAFTTRGERTSEASQLSAHATQQCHCVPHVPATASSHGQAASMSVSLSASLCAGGCQHRPRPVTYRLPLQ